MNFNRFLYSLITFAVSLFFILLGLIAILFPISSTIREAVLTFVLEESWTLAVFGLGFFLTGIALAAQILFSSKKQTIAIGTTTHPVEISEAVVHDYLKHYWETLFPEDEVPCRIAIKKNKILVSADLPFCEAGEQKALIKKMDSDLGNLMRDFLGLTKSLHLTISFAKTKSK